VTSVDPERLLMAGAIVEEIIGRPLLSKTQRASHVKAIEKA
jgi:hypothetical protein